MAPVNVDPSKVREFADMNSFYQWLSLNQASQSEVWIKMHKVGSGLPSVTWSQAVDAALCWGWIDGIRKSHDDKSFLHRYTPRGPKSTWSKINIDKVARLITQGLMTEHGLAHVSTAKADGRWERAYGSGQDLKTPEDLLAAIDAEPAAKAMLANLSEQNRFAMAFRTQHMKTEAGRKKTIARFVAMLAKGETLYPQRRK
jgi:uncharacterized protein YdeI (YjbR/CyaY-like superfamily)